MLEQLEKELVKIFLWVVEERTEAVGRRREEEKRVKSIREVMTRIDAREGRRDPIEALRKVGLRGARRQCQACEQVILYRIDVKVTTKQKSRRLRNAMITDWSCRIELPCIVLFIDPSMCIEGFVG